jgi:hypothetical protein
MYGLYLSSPCPLLLAVSAGVAISEVPRDQGFTRPKALLLLPMRSSAHKVVSRLVQLALGTDKGAVVHNKDRWEQQGCDAVPTLRHHLVVLPAFRDAAVACCCHVMLACARHGHASWLRTFITASCVAHSTTAAYIATYSSSRHEHFTSRLALTEHSTSTNTCPPSLQAGGAVHGSRC